MSDFSIENHGSILLLHPRTESARNWLEENVGQDNGYQPYWPTVVIEPRYVESIMQGVIDAGLEVA